MATSNYHAQRKAVAQQRAEQAFAMQQEGKTLQEIGDALGISAEAVRKALKKREVKADDKMADKIVEARCSNLDRLELLWQIALPVAQATGDPKSINAAVGILSEKAKLLGLNAPTKTALTDSKGKDVPQTAMFRLAMPMSPEEWTATAAARRDSEG